MPRSHADALRRPRLPVAVLLLRLRGRTRQGQRQGLHRRARRDLQPALPARPPVRTGADRRADRRHLRAGQPGAVVRVHDPAHRRPRTPACPRRAGRPRRRLRRLHVRTRRLPGADQRNPGRVVQGRLPRQLQARPRWRVAEGQAHDARRRTLVFGQRGGRRRGGVLRGVRIFEFDADGRLLSRIAAESGKVDADASWQLTSASVTEWSDNTVVGDRAQVRETLHPDLVWKSTLGADIVSAAVLPLATMSTYDLFRYVRHLASNEQASQRHEIQFWKRALYPFACVVMIALALPFAYFHARTGGVSLKVSAARAGDQLRAVEQRGQPYRVVEQRHAIDRRLGSSALYLLLSLAAFSWLVRYR